MFTWYIIFISNASFAAQESIVVVRLVLNGRVNFGLISGNGLKLAEYGVFNESLMKKMENLKIFMHMDDRQCFPETTLSVSLPYSCKRKEVTYHPNVSQSLLFPISLQNYFF